MAKIELHLDGDSVSGDVYICVFTGRNENGVTWETVAYYDTHEEARAAVARSLPDADFSGEEVSEYGTLYEEFYVDGEPVGFIEGEKVED